MSPRDRRDEQGGAPIATYPLGSRSQFCRGRKPECPEETLEVRLRWTETRSTYNIVVEVEGVIDVHYASMTSQGVQHRVFYRDGHPSRYQLRPTGLNFGEQTGTGVFPLVIAVPVLYRLEVRPKFQKKPKSRKQSGPPQLIHRGLGSVYWDFEWLSVIGTYMRASQQWQSHQVLQE